MARMWMVSVNILRRCRDAGFAPKFSRLVTSCDAEGGPQGRPTSYTNSRARPARGRETQRIPAERVGDP